MRNKLDLLVVSDYNLIMEDYISKSQYKKRAIEEEKKYLSIRVKHDEYPFFLKRLNSQIRGKKFLKFSYIDEETKNINKIEYYKDKELHREYGPAFIGFLLQNAIKEIYYIDGKQYRKNDSGPSSLIRRRNVMLEERWTDKNGHKHREDGPAIVSPEHGEKFFIHGEELETKLLKKIPTTQEELMELIDKRFEYHLIINNRKVLLNQWFVHNCTWFYDKYRLLFA